MIERIDISMGVTAINGVPNTQPSQTAAKLTILYNTRVISRQTVLNLIHSNQFSKDPRICCLMPEQADCLLLEQTYTVTNTNASISSQTYFTVNEIIHEAARIYNFDMPSPGTTDYKTIRAKLDRFLENKWAMDDGKTRNKRYPKEIVEYILAIELNSYFTKKARELAQKKTKTN